MSSEIVARGCPEELVRTAKAAAALEGLYFNEWIRRAVEEKLRRKSTQEDNAPRAGRSASALLAPVRETDSRAQSANEDVLEIGEAKDCELCGKPCIAWGALWHCSRCGRNFPAASLPGSG